MKAVILAAGKGTRMRELTNELPKPMLRVQGKPILEHIVAGIVAAGVREIFIVTGWRAKVVENHFGDGKNLARASRSDGRSCRTARARRRNWQRISSATRRFS
jgi:NDP-sugar pyrophosphorylase family protein